MVGWTPRPFIFVHIPKCGGTSMEKALLPAATGKTEFRQLSDAERANFWLPCRHVRQHAKLRWLAQSFRLGEFFKFSFVRNPWERAVSQIHYLMEKRATTLFAGVTFKEKLRAYCATDARVWGHDLGACQVDYLECASGTVDFIGRFEHIQRDFAQAGLTLGLSPPPTLPHLFKSNRSRHYSAYYDAESAEWIRRRFARDIERFGYEFQAAPAEIIPPEHRPAPTDDSAARFVAPIPAAG